MGLSSTKTKSETKPIYSSQITGAANTVKDVYTQQAPNILATQGKLNGLLDTQIDKVNNGSATSNAASNYAINTAGGKGTVQYTADPYLKAVMEAKSGYTPSSYFTGLLDTDSTYKPSSYFETLMNGDANQNESLQGMIDLTNRDLFNTFAAQGGTRGLTGGTAIADIIAKNIADSDTKLRYGDYQYQTGRMDDAAKFETGRQDTADQSLAARQDSAASLEAQRLDAAREATANRGLEAAQSEADRRLQAQTTAAQQKLAAAQLAASLSGQEDARAAGVVDTATAAAGLPLSAATQYAGATGALLGPYTNQTTKQSGGLGAQLLGAGLSALAMSDERLKRNIVRVGQTEGGLPVYHFNYIWDDEPQIGVMAQDVAQKQPWALGPSVHGFMSVNYAEVR